MGTGTPCGLYTEVGQLSRDRGHSLTRRDLTNAIFNREGENDNRRRMAWNAHAHVYTINS